jgi:hypothetical protein
MMEAVRTSETSVDNHFTRQYNPEDSSEHLPGLLIYKERNWVKHNQVFFFFSIPVCAITASGVPGGTFVSMNRLVPCVGD